MTASSLGNLKTELTSLFSENRLKQVLARLSEKINPESERYRTMLNLVRRFNKLQDEKMADIIEYRVAKIETNQIGDAILVLLDALQEEDLIHTSPTGYDQLNNPICVITQDEKSDQLIDFFQQLNFSQLSLRPANLASLENLDAFDLIIFDNRDLGFCPTQKVFDGLASSQQNMILERISLLDHTIQQSSKFIVHYGDFLYWINQHRDRVHAANSPFSLYARTKEMIEFIGSYRV